MHKSSKTKTNLNIRIDRELKSQLDDFAKNNGIQTTSLVVGQLKKLLESGSIDKRFSSFASPIEQNLILKEMNTGFQED